MLFNSYQYLLILLPVSLAVYFILNKKKLTTASRVWLVLASLFFYCWWNVLYLPLMLGSILFNYVLGSALTTSAIARYKAREVNRRILLTIGVAANLGLLGYFKYADFFITNANSFFGADMGLLHLALPLGISFFTFTQIAYLVDSYRGDAKEYDPINYALFVTFFPHLIAGPIIHHKEMMPQFKAARSKVLNYKNISTGLFILSIGLFKKVVIADTFAVWATYGFDKATTLTLIEGWSAALSYTFQIYFDFSGYTDMAIGSALMFNIVLPPNFNSPYKATSVREFWRRWHMTLSRFLRDYVYIPLGGNRSGEARTCLNLVATFFLGGLWHGASWMFVVWGMLHGIALVAGRVWERTGLKLNQYIAWFLTFNFVCITWVFFRAKSGRDAEKVLKAMFGMNGYDPHASGKALAPICAALLLVILVRNSGELAKSFKPSLRTLAVAGCIAAYALLNMNRISDFLYFNF